jgi:undecaprenyl-diphosphatase
MDALIIFGAKYLFLLSPLLALLALIRLPHEKRKALALLGAVALPLAYLVALVARHFYFDPRPFVVGNFAPLIPHVPDNGFPSDHTLLAAALAAVVSSFDRRLGNAMWAVAIFVGLARVAAGVHHLTDILGSLAIALAAAIAAHAIISSLWNQSKNNQAHS